MSDQNQTRDPRSAFLEQAGEAQYADVLCPEPIGKVRAYCMTDGEREKFDLVSLKRRQKNKPANFRARLLIRCIRKDDGSPFFQPADLAALVSMPTRKTDLMFTACCQINGYTEDEAEDEEGN